MARPVLFLISLLGIALLAYADDGDLDRNFGNGGQVTTDVSWRDGTFASTLALQPDGKIILAGTFQPAGWGTSSTIPNDICLVRYNTDGSLDTSFGSSGIVITRLTEGFEDVSSVWLQPDGKIVAAGRMYTGKVYPGQTSQVVLFRYNTDGSLDQSFGPSGKIIFESFYEPPTDDVGYEPGGLVVQSDGKVVTAGVASFSEAYGTTGVVSLERYNIDGSLDQTFGASGKVTNDFSPAADWPTSLAIQPDGKIVASVTIRAMTYGADFGVARYNMNGSLDSSFGVSGVVSIDLSGSYDWALGVEILPDGKILVCGRAGSDLALVRYNHDGSLDTTFGTSGIVISDLLGMNESARSITLQSDGKILVLGTATPGAPSYLVEPSFVARYTRTGELDRTFGTDGLIRIPSEVSAMRIQNDGNIVVAGVTLEPWSSPRDFVLFRLLNSDVPRTIEVRFDPESLANGRSWTATFSGSNLNDETYFDVRFVPPNSSTEQVAFNWQRGVSVSHTLPIGTPIGTWKVTGVRPHQDATDHSGEFVLTAATLTVN
jgi:uncharacterized delta-60 repeat protein